MRAATLERAVERFESASGARLYRIPLDLFPELTGYAYLICSGETRALFDVGSGFGDSNEMLDDGLEQIRARYDERVSWDEITHVLISHGHIDHFGGLQHVRHRTRAPIGVHELDRKVLTSYQDRLAIIALRLQEYLVEAGVPADQAEEVMGLYLLNKQLFEPIDVDFTFEMTGRRIGDLQLFHLPGHCPGQVVMLVDDILLSSDHVLAQTSPHQAPERLSLGSGLDHYLRSLERTRPLARRARLTLAGHEAPIEDLEARIDAIEGVHLDRLEHIYRMLDDPMTISEISNALFPSPQGYHKLLALEETGAHVEFLALRGFLSIANAEDLESHRPVPIRYRRLNADLKDLSELRALLQARKARVDADV